MTHAVTHEDLLERVQQLAPVIQEHADRGEQERHLADPVVAAIQEAGLYRMLVPRALGGLQVDPLTFYQVVEALARVDGSAGWCMFIQGSAPLSVGFLQDEAAETMCGKGARMIQSATIFPFGRAVPHKGGYRVSGHWVYASGCWHSTWHMVACNVYEEGATEPRADPAGLPELIMAHLPRSQVQVLDTWHVSGLSATGSHDVEVHEGFVPEAFVWKFAPHPPRGSHFGDPLYRFPFMGLWGWPIAAVALGIAQGAIDESMRVAQRKTPRLSASTLREQSLFQTQLAKAVALVCSARSWLHEVVSKIWEKAVHGAEASFAERAEFLLAATNATRSSAAAVELAYTAGGGSANYRKSPLQRQMRDIHAVTQHIALAPIQYENSGRMLLGLQPDNPFILL
jgi:alkylation response protein AidB-like acyl-CoA dehydrogenase